MSIEPVDHSAMNLALGHGRDLPDQAARARAVWVAGRQGRPPLLLVALLWARECTDAVQRLERYLDALFADYDSTPRGWSEAQAGRQVLAALNQQLFRQRQRGRRIGALDAGLLLLQGDEAHFLQAGAIGLLRYQGGSLQSLDGREGMQLGMQAELALVQHSLPLSPGQPLLLAPQALLAVADLDAFRSACQGLEVAQLSEVLAPLLKAPSAAVLLLAGAAAEAEAVSQAEHWPAQQQAYIGMQLDGWTLLDACPFGPPGRLFRAHDAHGREALLWLAPRPVDEVFRQHEWAVRRSTATSLPLVLSPRQPRRHAFLLYEPPNGAACSLSDWLANHGPPDGQMLLALLEQLIVAVRALQRRGMQGLWLDPCSILVDDRRRLLFLPEHAALLPGVPRQDLPAEALVLAPELRAREPVDGRADQFALAALAYWLLGGQWPEVALAKPDRSCRYRPLVAIAPSVPAGWDGVLARALAPQPQARFAALSEFQLALQQPRTHVEASMRVRGRRGHWQWALLAVLALQLGIGLWLSLQG
jgi:hypothetical protein